MVFWVPILCYAAVVACTVIAYLRTGAPHPPLHVAHLLLRYLNLFPVGLMGLWAALGHLVLPAQSAAAIGWATSPFQAEVGAANLGLGLAGVAAAFYADWGFRAGVAVVTTGFLGGAALTHVFQIAETGNRAAGNAGPILYTDVLTPLLLLILLALTFRSARGSAA